MTYRYLLLAVALFSATLSFGQAETKSFSNIEKAKTYASENKKVILMVFAGSDWCRPCMQFKKEILESEAFATYAKDQMVLLYLDFPARKANKLPAEQTQHNERLAEKYNQSGAFPRIVVLDGNEKMVGVINFKNQSAEDFIAECKKLLQS